jgi:hypothetical protein
VREKQWGGEANGGATGSERARAWQRGRRNATGADERHERIDGEHWKLCCLYPTLRHPMEIQRWKERRVIKSRWELINTIYRLIKK